MLLAVLTPWLFHPSLAQAVAMAASASDPVTIIAASGVAGACLVLFAYAAMTGRIRFPSEVQHLEMENAELKADLKAERAEKDALRDQLIQTLPTVSRAAQAMVQQATPVIQHADVQQTQLAETFAHLLDRAEAVLRDERRPDAR